MADPTAQEIATADRVVEDWMETLVPWDKMPSNSALDRLASVFAAALAAHAAKVRETNALYDALTHGLIARILAADATCDPPHDVDLRLASIIMERDELRAAALRAGSGG